MARRLDRAQVVVRPGMEQALPLAVGMGVALTLACATAQPAPAGVPADQRPSSGQPAATSVGETARAANSMGSADTAAESFLAALQGRDYVRARTGFDTRLKEALSEEKLAAVWTSLVTDLGNLVSWKVVQRADEAGKAKRAFELTFEKGRRLAVVVVHPDTHQIRGIFFQPMPAAQTPARYIDQKTFHGEEVRVGAEPYLLSGTLTLPVESVSFPAVILVHGSGPHDRDGSIGPNKPLKDLAEGLSSHGIAVLRYDKRTFQYTQKVMGRDVTVDEEVIFDAVAAANLLRMRTGVDAHRIFIVGHSLGALLAPEIALRAGFAAGVVLLAPPGRPPWDMLLAQMRYLKVPPDRLESVRRTIEAVQAGRLDAGDLMGASPAYWRDLAGRDGIAMGRRLNRPILILRGDRDYQVTDEDIAMWRKGLSGIHDVQIETVRGDNHLFIPGSGEPGPTEYEVPGHVDEQVIRRLETFIAASG